MFAYLKFLNIVTFLNKYIKRILFNFITSDETNKKKLLINCLIVLFYNIMGSRIR